MQDPGRQGDAAKVSRRELVRRPFRGAACLFIDIGSTGCEKASRIIETTTGAKSPHSSNTLRGPEGPALPRAFVQGCWYAVFVTFSYFPASIS
jgi:hypothetical protein